MRALYPRRMRDEARQIERRRVIPIQRDYRTRACSGWSKAVLALGGFDQLHPLAGKGAMHLRHVRQGVDVADRLVAADLLDAGKAERVPGVVPARLHDGVECHLEDDFWLHEPETTVVFQRDRLEIVGHL